MALATGQITLLDFNDIYTSSSPPTNPVTNKLWIDTSISPNKLKRWTGSEWSETGSSLDDILPINNGTIKVRYIRDWMNGNSSNTSNHWVEIKAMAGNINRAYGKTVELYNSSNVLQSWNVTYPGTRITDGDITSSNFAIGVSSINLQYVEIDLGDVYEDINYLHIWHYYADGRRYFNTKTEVSEDGISWKILHDSNITGTYAEPATGDGKVILVNGGGIIQYASDKIYRWLKSGTSFMDGGQIAADSISVDKLSVGNRGLQFSGFEISSNSPSANTLYWTSGSVIWINDTNTLTTSSVSPGNSIWTTGTLYLYWSKNNPQVFTTTTSSATAYNKDNVIIAIYNGDTDLVVNYGRAIIDGSDIVASTITADKIKTSTMSASTSVTVGGIIIDSGSGTNNGNIRLGQTGFDTGTGFWLGNFNGIPKLSLGNETNKLIWDGSTLTVNGSINVVPGSTGYSNFTDKPSDETILNEYNSYNVLNVPADAELFSFNKNITGSKGTAPLGSSSEYTRITNGGVFGYDCIEITSSNKIVYPNLETQINWEKFSILCWVKRLTLGGQYALLMGTWPNSYFGFTPSNTLIYSWIDGTQKQVISSFGITDYNWHLIGMSADKTNSKIYIYMDNTFEEFNNAVNYNNTPTSYTIGQIAYDSSQYPLNSQIDNMVIFKNSAINETYVKGVFNAMKPFFDQGPILVAKKPTSATMSIIEDYTETEYAIDGYTYTIG